MDWGHGINIISAFSRELIITSLFSQIVLSISITAEALLFTINEDSQLHKLFNNVDKCKFLSPLLPDFKSNSRLQ